MLARNYRVFASMNGIAIDDSLVEGEAADDEDDDGDDDGAGDMQMDDEDRAAAADGAVPAGPEAWGGMDVDGGDDGGDDDDLPAFFKEQPAGPPAKTPSRRKKTKVDELVRTKVLRVLDQLELAERRSRQCDETDFLRLLDAVGFLALPFRLLLFSCTCSNTPR